MRSPGLEGIRILVAEDEYYFADDLAAELEAAGATCIGPFPSITEALASLDQADAVVLDINLSGERADPLARQLCDRAVPFVVVTGYSDTALPAWLGSAPVVRKPCSSAEVLTALSALLSTARQTTG